MVTVDTDDVGDRLPDEDQGDEEREDVFGKPGGEEIPVTKAADFLKANLLERASEILWNVRTKCDNN